MKPLAIDLYCGLGGWAEGLLAENWRVIGFDIERHVYGEHRYPGHLVIQDVRTLHGSQFKGADLIVASPPCQEYSYMAMPWSRAKAIAAEYRAGKRDVKQLTALFDACFRIQREACEAAGRHIPLVVENVRGAEPWVGQAQANFGSFYLWGDAPVPQPDMFGGGKRQAMARGNPKLKGGDRNKAHTNGGDGHIWSSGRNTDGHKLPSFRFDGSGRSFQTASVEGMKHDGSGWNENGTLKSCNRMVPDYIKCGGDWFNAEQPSISRMSSSKSSARKAASALIAKIPEPLAWHVARAYRP